MSLERHVGVLSTLAGDLADLSGSNRVALIAEVQQVRGWIDAREAELLALVHAARDDIDAGARDISQLVQQQANVGFGEAKRRELRSRWAAELPELGDALESGRLGTVHVDEICLLAERLPATHRPVLRRRLGDLIAGIASLTPVRARKRLVAFEAEFDDADDGESRLQRQRRSNRLRMPKRPDGMVGLQGALDPVSAGYVRTAVDAKVAEMWRRERRGRDELDPPDRVLTSDQRRAAALVEWVRAGASAASGGRGRAEIIVHIDHQSLLDALVVSPLAQLADGAAIPAAEARRLACEADVIPVVLGGPSEPLDVGRASRVATSAQPAALRAVHDSCCIDGCDVAFDYCETHHISWWRLGGMTDLDNLVPVCNKHHHLIHDHAWRLVVDDHRTGRLTHRGATRRVERRECADESVRPRPQSGWGAANPRHGPRPADQRPPPRPPDPAVDSPPMRC